MLKCGHATPRALPVRCCPLYAVQLGRNRGPRLFGQEEYTSYLHWLREALGDAECVLHAYPKCGARGYNVSGEGSL